MLKSAVLASDAYIIFINGRVCAELYCMMLQHVSGAPLAGVLYEDIHTLPDWGWEHLCSQYVAPNPGLVTLSAGIDLEVKVYQDLHFLRKMGNVSAHARLRMEQVDSIDDFSHKVKEAMCRIGLVIAVWACRLPPSRL